MKSFAQHEKFCRDKKCFLKYDATFFKFELNPSSEYTFQVKNQETTTISIHFVQGCLSLTFWKYFATWILQS